MTSKTDDKPIAKSLHTITVLVQVAKLTSALRDGLTIDKALAGAVEALGMEGREDPYGLIDKARDQLLRLEAAQQEFTHAQAVMGKLNLTPKEWAATPEKVRAALISQHAEA